METTEQLAPKQVIVMRRDLGMRRGKEIAQGSHASMAFLSRRVGRALSAAPGDGDGTQTPGLGLWDEARAWLRSLRSQG